MATSERDDGSRVKSGGLWNFQPIQYSKETQELLSVLMKEAKLSLVQQRQLQENVSRGLPLPVNKEFRGKNPFVTQPRKPKPRRVLASGIRTKVAILKSGCYERERFKPEYSYVRQNREKERLQNIMAYGQDIVVRKRPMTEREPSTPNTKRQEKFEQLVEEIDERKKFLDEMEQLGAADQVSTIISSQISQKLRELELLDKECPKPESTRKNTSESLTEEAINFEKT